MIENHRSVIKFPKSSCSLHSSIFIFIDWQLEYLSSGRAYALGDVEQSLSNSLSLLEHARKIGMTIAHFRRLMDGTFFNQATKFSSWIDDLKPRPNEMVFERKELSIYSNPAFVTFLESINLPELIVSGLTGERSCLSTAVDGAHRNHSLIFVKDASASSSVGNLSEKRSHELVCDIINLYADVKTTREMIATMTDSRAIERGSNEVRYK
ncbi:MAG: hypothetical protein DHS20C07_17010 [Methyloligella sp.]|nr:MAG: hypothetical protein DHS20C07_17010 [Methyloligella sp.]